MQNLNAAIDDLIFIKKIDLTTKDSSFVFIKNNNKGKDILARVRLEGDSTFKVYDLTSKKSTQHNLFPHEFEILVKSGTTNYIGHDRFDHLETDWKHHFIVLDYKLLGAV